MLTALLEKNLAYSALYRGGLSNHLSMALIALARLGANDAQLETFFERYVARLEPREKAWPQRELSSVSELADGIGAAAFHGLIRTAYALESGLQSELWAGLEAWAQSHLPLGATRQPALNWSGPKPKGDTIHERMRQVAASAEFQAQLTDAGPCATLPEVRDLAVRTYWATNGDFTALHLVTATHAFRVVQTQTPLPIEPFLAAVSAAWITIGPPPIDIKIPRCEVPWPDIVARAIVSPDDHTIKLVYTCREEERASGDPRYRALAARRVKLF